LLTGAPRRNQENGVTTASVDECTVRAAPDDLLSPAAGELLAGVLKVLADPARLRILYIIRGSEEGEVCVCDLVGPLGLAQSTVSHHLKILHDAGLVLRDRRGTWGYYRLAPGTLTGFDAFLAGIRSVVPSHPQVC